MRTAPLAGHPEVFAIGDMVSLNKLPGVAQPAMQEGKYVGKAIKARSPGMRRSSPFKYFDKGSMATIGHRSAVADAFGMKFTGVIGYTMWGFIHVLYLVDWGHRFGTVYNWARAMTFGSNRSHRIITYEQAHDHAEHSDGRSGRPTAHPALNVSAPPAPPQAGAQPQGARDVDLTGKEARTTASP